MKRLIAIFLIIASLLSLAGCGLQLTQKENDGDATRPGQETTAPASTGPAESPTATPEASAEPELPPVRAIVFDDTVGDDMFGATLKLTLFETSPGVFDGEGVIETSMDMDMPDNTLASRSVGRLNFVEARLGETLQLVSLERTVYEQSASWGDAREDLGLYTHHAYVTSRRPTEYTLTLEGDSARMDLDMYTFSGVLTQLPPAKPKPSLDYLDSRCISVNSTFYETGNTYNDEYRAMLMAKRGSGYDYSGDLCVYGSGRDIPLIDEAITFTLVPFDAHAYSEAGGVLTGSFDAFGVTAGGQYIVLLDGDKSLIEATGSGIAFYGMLLADNELSEARRVADESKQLMCTLYDGCDKEKIQIGSAGIFSTGIPAWYPHWLMPKPINPDSWEWEGTPNVSLFNSYVAQYIEYDLNIDQVYESYLSQLSGYENFETYIVFYELSSEAVFYFTKGVYSIAIRLDEGPSRFVGVEVTIT